MALIKLNRTKTGTVPKTLADGELYIDQLNGWLYWADATSVIRKTPLLGPFLAGTRALFQQASAPVGWTKDTAHNNKGLRVVSGSVGSGGTVGFTSVFNATVSTGETALTSDQMPAHTHGVTDPGHTHSYEGFNTANGEAGGSGRAGNPASKASGNAQTGISITSAGGGKGHAHTLNLNLAYVDVIIAVKD
jgi:hypothetical protein